ncbi:MAG: SAM-dependent methyltransferase [Chromatiales bacterium]|nr:SAM-dependent methyltransferase [Chromatiales bacterium]
MEGLDQFYTAPEVARKYVASIIKRWDDETLFIEPSAGDGAFLTPLLDKSKKVRAIDKDPKSKGIIEGDFLKCEKIFRGSHQSIVVVGNPPFGRNGSLAVKFFNRAADYSDEIAFIVPRTFRKMSVQKRLHRYFHLGADEDVKEYAFYLNGKPHDVPCAWQVWTRKPKERRVPVPPSVDHLIKYTTPTHADFAMRRVGFYAGRVTTTNIKSLSQTTHYFIKEMTKGIMKTLSNTDWSDLVGQTVGARSLSKTEIAFKLNEVYYA